MNVFLETCLGFFHINLSYKLYIITSFLKTRLIKVQILCANYKLVSNLIHFFFVFFFFITVDFLILIKKRDVVYLYGNVIQTIVLDETVTGLRTLVVY